MFVFLEEEEGLAVLGGFLLGVQVCKAVVVAPSDDIVR